MQPDVVRTNSRRAQWVVVGLVTLALGCGSDATAPTVDDPGLGDGPFQGWFIAAGENRLVFSQDGDDWYDVDQFGESVLNLTGRSMIDVAATRARLVLTEVNEGEISRFQSGPDRMEVRTIPSPIFALATDQQSFLGFGRYGIYGSSDGLDFALLDTNLGFPLGGLEVNPNLVHGGGRYVTALTFRDAVLQFRMGIATSEDGITWEATNVWARQGFHVDLLEDEFGFVALGVRGVPDDANRVVWISPDGLTWSEQRFAGLTGPTPRTLARASSGRLVVLGGGEQGVYRWYSDDEGSTWQEDQVIGGGEDAPLDMLFAEGRFLAVLESGRIATSVDGESWTAAYPASTPGGALRSIHYVK
jgi:hypothetical protein